MKISDFNKKEKLILSILAGWFCLHLILLIVSKGSTKYFWPFDNEPKLSSDYDITEFLVYAIIPIGVFLFYKFLNSKSEDSK